jgi:hypothetical protein
MIAVRDIFQDSPEEEGAYTRAVRENPRIVDLEAEAVESPLAYIQRIAEIVAQHPLPKPSKRIPPRPRLNREYAGPREPIQENGLTFEDRTDAIYERQPGEEG